MKTGEPKLVLRSKNGCDLMRVKYLGESSPIELLNGKEYEVLSIEDGWYRIVDETFDDYLYPPEAFEIVEENDGSVPILSIEDIRRNKASGDKG